MVVVGDGGCRPYVAEWADASPTWYGLPTQKRSSGVPRRGGWKKGGWVSGIPWLVRVFLVNPPRLAKRSGNLFSATPIALYSLALDILETIGPSPRDAKHLLLHCSLDVDLHSPLPCEPFPRPPTRIVSIIFRHSPSLSIILPHSPSFSVILRHSPSFSFILRHSPSFSGILHHFPSFSVTFRHSLDCFHNFPSFSVTFPWVVLGLFPSFSVTFRNFPSFSVIPRHSRQKVCFYRVSLLLGLFQFFPSLSVIEAVLRAKWLDCLSFCDLSAELIQSAPGFCHFGCAQACDRRSGLGSD